MEQDTRVALARVVGIEHLLKGVDTEIAVAAAPGEILTVYPGDTVRVRASLDYLGPVLNDTFYVAIGNRVVAFDEIWVGSVSISLPQSTSFVTYQLTADVSITQVAVLPWTPGYFDMYCKLVGNLGAGLPELTNVIQILLKGQFQNFKITGYDKV